MYNKRNSEYLRIQGQKSRARCMGALATLTLVEWEQTIADFNGLCAYCQEERFSLLEHFRPIHIAGTCVNNCLPACHHCNNKKGDSTGDSLVSKFGQATIERIRAYLNMRHPLPQLPDHEKYTEYKSLSQAKKELGISDAGMQYHLNRLRIERKKFPRDKRVYITLADFDRIRAKRSA